MIGHARHDENNRYSNGLAGDQTGQEVAITEWYSRPWNVVLRCKDRNKAEIIAKTMEAACKNNKIGYDQNQRTTLFTQAKAVKWDISKITTACETDCSALVAVCVNSAGITVSKDIYTGNERNALKNTGMFDVLTGSKYLDSDRYLLRGDILLYEGHHTAINLTNGLYAIEGWEKQANGTWKYKKNGSYVKDKWLEISGRWYAFDGAGKMLSEVWKGSDSKGWYYLGKDGAMLASQWLKYKNKDYYLMKDGKMATDAYILSSDKNKYYYVDKNGVWDTKRDTNKPDIKKVVR